MWSEEMDKKIRAAAENAAPGYDEKSWQGMEVLLNKHLPEKKKKRRIIFFLLAGLLVTGVTAYFISQKTSSGNNPVVENSSQQKNNQPAGTGIQQKTVTTPPSGNNNTNTPGITEAKPRPAETNTNGDVPTTAASSLQTPDPNKPVAAATGGNTTITKPAIPGNDKASANFNVRNGGVGGKRQSSINTTVSNAPVASNPDKPVPAGNETTTQIQPPVATDIVKDVAKTETAKELAETVQKESLIKPADSAITTTAKKEEPVKKDPAKKSGFFSKFFISFSAGPDLSTVGTDPGQWQGQYGAGIGYAFSDKWSVRTGFYVARKLYSADSNNYKTVFTSLPGGVYGPYKLSEIKANCLVYEIPVNVVYSFAKNKKHNWFVSAGISSYIMKTERYDCSYKNNIGQWQNHSYSYKNENTHLFSVAGISGGYQYNFNKRLFLMAEPYVKVPLTGVGQGKVKLNSIGGLFTIGYKPFATGK
jgi:hypothetical protein